MTFTFLILNDAGVLTSEVTSAYLIKSSIHV